MFRADSRFFMNSSRRMTKVVRPKYRYTFFLSVETIGEKPMYSKLKVKVP